MQFKNFLVCGGLALLAACGGGGGSPGTCMASAITCASISGSNPNPPPAAAAAPPIGSFRGTTGDGRNIAVVVLETGELWLIYSGPGSTTRIAGAQQAHGAFSNGTFSGPDARDFSVERAALGSAPLSGTFVERSSVAGTATLAGLAVPFAATYDISSSLPASVSTIAGSYAGSIGTLGGIDNASFTISADGSLTGASQLGCRFSGVLSPQATVNAYAVSVAFQGGTCSRENAGVAGVALFDSGARRLSAAALTSDRANGFIFEGTK